MWVCCVTSNGCSEYDAHPYGCKCCSSFSSFKGCSWEKRSNGVKSHDLGGQIWSPKLEITWRGLDSCSNWIVPSLFLKQKMHFFLCVAQKFKLFVNFWTFFIIELCRYYSYLHLTIFNFFTGLIAGTRWNLY